MILDNVTLYVRFQLSCETIKLLYSDSIAHNRYGFVKLQYITLNYIAIFSFKFINTNS
jgi:hypothetical protein